ncbi:MULTISPECIES: ISAzo13-like element transposase-related protein [unclassified Microcoleus]|uniref:ISAzo13-like element transposase-related protein n=1 Tax=unclassified Microcoleus TaxID=2642155 RepID=UPI00403F49B6
MRSRSKVVTYGIYEYQQNRVDLKLENSKYTNELASDSLKKWWNNYGIATYPNANSIWAIR